MSICIRTCTHITSSLKAAAFQVVLARDSRGLVYRARKDILSIRQLSQTPIVTHDPKVLRGRLKMNCGK
ncbi:hypothetical protein HC248_01914 [Polaromonas vacuolata]|uniref:Uncharacterized protein n=1 Tax=Polaromonas vacuolata TaxID=37448 RepID=A0A6H2HAV6_9BURK|nr:hypothetical protein HC248_01914 [Polaromonas vacuolata]